MTQGTIALGVALVMGTLLAGCVSPEGCLGAQGYTGQTGTCNMTDSFSYGVNVSMHSSTDTYIWENTQGRAQVHWGANAGMGSVTVTLLDANGEEVYRDSLSGAGQKGGTHNSGRGTPGDWTIRIHYSGYTGQMGLGIQAIS